MVTLETVVQSIMWLRKKTEKEPIEFVGKLSQRGHRESAKGRNEVKGIDMEETRGEKKGEGERWRQQRHSSRRKEMKGKKIRAGMKIGGRKRKRDSRKENTVRLKTGTGWNGKEDGGEGGSAGKEDK